MKFGQRLKEFRKAQGFTQRALGDRLGIGITAVLRMENGTSKPSTEAAKILRSMGFGDIAPNETKLVSTPRSRLHVTDGEQLRKLEAVKVQLGAREFPILPSPYVNNGPADQIELFERLYRMQSLSDVNGHINSAARRLSALSFVNGLNVRTAQHELENPSVTSRHWNPNYGVHGFHRYVGRFPPHLVRALLNHFNATNADTVCDPFCGSGTTLAEARMLGIPAIGIDICPLSCLITRTKSQFPKGVSALERQIQQFSEGYVARWEQFLRGRSADEVSHEEITQRDGNSVPAFPNYQKWLSGSALLGCSIAVELIEKLEGYVRDFFACALSSRMRSIGNLDVDVVRAEYSKVPRTDVDVLKNVQQAASKMLVAIGKTQSTHHDLIGDASNVRVIEGDLLSAKLPERSVRHIITSPPYGVEALSYLRTHLLSYRVLHPILKHDPYAWSDQIIGSEYLNRNPITQTNWRAAHVSEEFGSFFSVSREELWSKKLAPRTLMMCQFFDQLMEVARQFNKWLLPNGRVAFVVGNKRLGEFLIPTDRIIIQIFRAFGFELDQEIKHKLKCSNTNSEVPWQERVIQDEFVLLFTKRTDA